MKELFEYLAQFPVDHHGISWVLASHVVNDTGISREALWEISRRVKLEAFLDCVTTNVPCTEGFLSVTISPRGGLWLKGEDYLHLSPRREKIYNLL
ncbi:MAG: hypothetical protein NWE88_07285 [Candidatus Bathyarchaeota archaeon]|nr:hypothetical protein [Candidatus Bathyarchaeota archaeon]